jgi:hypothetical protein
MSLHPLVDVYGHTLTEDGEYRYKFKILGPIDAQQTKFAVCLYSCVDDRDTDIVFLEIDDLTNQAKCLLYATHREWQFRDRNQNYGRESRHKRTRDEGLLVKPGTGRVYESQHEMEEAVRRDRDSEADAVRYGRSRYPW